jgi:hypothetical protein
MKTLLSIAILLLAGILCFTAYNSDMAFHQDTMNVASAHHLTPAWAVALIMQPDRSIVGESPNFRVVPFDSYTIGTLLYSGKSAQ